MTTRGKMDIRKNRWNLTDKALTDDFALSNMQNIAWIQKRIFSTLEYLTDGNFMKIIPAT